MQATAAHWAPSIALPTVNEREREQHVEVRGAESEFLPQNADFTIYCPPAVTTRHYGIYCVFDGPR